MKLSHKYFGPYNIVWLKIGPVAYKLELPPESLGHLVFHVSLLKKKIGNRYSPTTALPKLSTNG